jgi:hypothetical protein
MGQLASQLWFEYLCTMVEKFILKLQKGSTF